MYALVSMSRCEVDGIGQFLFKLNHYLRYGYVYWYSKEIKSTSDYSDVDSKLRLIYDVTFNRNLRASRKKKGIRNIIYFRYKNRFIMLASEGSHREFDRLEFFDFRERAFLFAGYSVKVKQRKASIKLEKLRFERVKKKARAIALHDAEKVSQFLREISPFSFRGVEEQRWKLYLMVNKRRKDGGLKRIEWKVGSCK